MSAIGLQWGDKLSDPFAVSTITMAMGATTTIMNPVKRNILGSDDTFTDDFSDDDIENTINEIQRALQKNKSAP